MRSIIMAILALGILTALPMTTVHSQAKLSKKERKRLNKQEEKKAYNSQFKDPFESFQYFVKEGEDYVKATLDKNPAYFEGSTAFLIQVYSNMPYPAEARKKGVQGTVRIELMVDEFGKMTQTEITHGIGGGCEEAALLAVNSIEPKMFEPAQKDGRPVAVRFEIPIKFKLE